LPAIHEDVDDDDLVEDEYEDGDEEKMAEENRESRELWVVSE